MVVRVDTTNITRGLDFSIIVQSGSEPVVSLYAFNAASHEIEQLDYTMQQSGIFFKALSKAPYFDGYLLAKINSKFRIVKKIGHPTPHFVIGYKPNYTVPYELFNENGVILNSGNLTSIIDGFYYCEIPLEITVMQTLKKRFILKDNMTKLNYDVNIGNTTLEDVYLPEYSINSELGNVVLSSVVLEDVTVNAELADVEIKEY